MLRGLIVVILLLIAAPVWAATIYVDHTLVSDCTTSNYSIASRNCTGSDGNAYNTIAEGRDAMVAGDVLRIRGGTVNDRISMVSKAGTSSAPFTIEAYPGETVVLQTTSTSYGFLISSSQWITVNNITIDGINSAATNLTNRIEGVTTANVTLDGMVFKRWVKQNGLFVDKSTNLTITNSSFTDNAACISGQRAYGIYLHDVSNVVITKSVFTGNAAGGLHLYPGPHTNITISKNTVANNSSCNTFGHGGIIVAADSSGGNISGVVIDRNLIYGNTPTGTSSIGIAGIRTYATGGRTQTGTKIINNTIYDHQATGNSAYGINLQAGSSGTIVTNNHVIGNQTSQIIDGGTGTTLTTNRTSGVITDCTVSTTDFTQKAASSCIDAGTEVTGFAYNGSKPDQGAFESFACGGALGAEVGLVDATSLLITCENNGAPPVLPSSGITGITVRENTTPVTVSACARVGDNVIDCTLASSITGGTTVDWSYSQTGNLTSSNLIGGTLNQELLTVTNSAVTNNVGGAAPTHTFTQSVFEYHGLRGTEAAPVMKPDGLASTGAAENVARMEVMVGGSIRVRFSVLCGTADCPATGFYPRYSRNSGAYDNVIPDTFGADKIGFCGVGPDPDIPTNGTQTTNQLSGGTGFVAGALVRTSNAIPTVDLDHTTNTKVELEYCFTFASDATAGDTYDIRLYQQDGTALDAYTNTPRITLVGVAGGSGFSQLWDLMILTMLPMLGRIETQTMKPLSNLMVSYPSLDQILVECPSGTGLKTTGTGTKRTLTCLH